MEKYDLKLTEFEILTLREGLFQFKASKFNNLSEMEFDEIDEKLTEVFE